LLAKKEKEDGYLTLQVIPWVPQKKEKEEKEKKKKKRKRVAVDGRKRRKNPSSHKKRAIWGRKEGYIYERKAGGTLTPRNVRQDFHAATKRSPPERGGGKKEKGGGGLYTRREGGKKVHFFPAERAKPLDNENRKVSLA